MSQKRIGGIIALFSLASICFAQHPDAGSTLFPLLNINYDARSAALSGASVALPADVSILASNPGALGFANNEKVFLGYRSIQSGIWGMPISYVRKIGDLDVVAISASSLFSGDIPITEMGNDGGPVITTRSANANYLCGGVSWARRINDFAGFGATLKGLYSYIGSASEHFSSDGVAMDIGSQYRFMNSRLIYGIALRNFGFIRSGYTKEDRYKLPTAIETGVSFIPRDLPMSRLLFNAHKKTGDYLVFKPGFETLFINGAASLRIGYSLSWKDAEEGVKFFKGEEISSYRTTATPLCFGGGIKTSINNKKVGIDIALEIPAAKALVPQVVISVVSEM